MSIFFKKNYLVQKNNKKEHVPMYITIIHIDNNNQGCKPLILLKSK